MAFATGAGGLAAQLAEEGAALACGDAVFAVVTQGPAPCFGGREHTGRCGMPEADKRTGLPPAISLAGCELPWPGPRPLTILNWRG